MSTDVRREGGLLEREAADRDDEGGVDVLAFLATLWRRRAIVLGVAAIFTALALIVIFQLTPRYESAALVRIDAPKSNVVDIEAVLQDSGQEQGFVETEIEVISSHDVIGRVVDKLRLMENPVFNPEVGEKRQPSPWRFVSPGYYFRLAGELFSATSAPARQSLSAEDRDTELRGRIIDRIAGMMDVKRKRLSSVIAIGIESEDPALAARLANTIAGEYLVSQYEAKFQAAETATTWLNERLGTMRRDVEAAEQALEQFRARSGLLSRTGGNSLLTEQASQLNAQLILARTDAATANAKLAQVEDLYQSGGVAALSKFLTSDAIARLRAQESDLNRQYADMSQEMGERHPKMISLHAQIEDTREQIRQEVDKTLGNLRSEAAAARTKAQTLQSGLNAMQGEAGARSEQSAQLATLEREAQAKRVMFDTFLKRFQETSASEGLQQADATIISRAQVPRQPSFPPMRQFLILAMLASVGAGVGAGLFVDRILDRGFRRLDQVEAATGLPALGSIPQTQDGDLIATVLRKPNSSYTEALRNLHAGIRLSSIDNEAKVILFVSAVPGEGKTSVSTSLAVLLAHAGHKVLLVDCDLRRGRVHDRLGLLPKPGLVELLVEPELVGAVQVHAPSGLDVIVSGGSVRSPQDLLGSNAMREFLARARQRYDYVLVDTPPSGVVSEARLLAAAADRVVLIAKWNSTPRNIVTGAERQLRDAGAHFAGVILSQVAPRSGLIYGYDSYSPYYGKYGEYYQD
ncbi:polysaccharide biosynthesis tyrosine autokinase [Emcibacter sp. SYSU 3D8]|uniref:GumC family protein n=1 Tax=Emcibacter sp. SYSU 3D8 TaxID=3133969 RepID=UPI0031FEB36B